MPLIVWLLVYLLHCCRLTPQQCNTTLEHGIQYVFLFHIADSQFFEWWCWQHTLLSWYCWRSLAPSGFDPHNANAFTMLPQTVWSLYSLQAMTLMCCFATLNYCFLWGDWGWGDTPNDASSNAMPPHHKSFNSPLTLALALTLFPCHNTTGHCAIHASIFLPQHFLRNYCSSLANILQLVKEAKRSFIIF